MLYFTRDQVQRWAGPLQFKEGVRLFEQGAVKSVAVETDWLNGVLSYGDRDLTTRLRVLKDGTVDTACPCRDARERGLICSHVVAAGLAYADEISDPQLDREQRIERRRAKERLSGPGPGFLRRVSAQLPGALPAQLELRLASDWSTTAAQGAIGLSLFVITGRGRERADRVGANPRFTWSPRDEFLLYLLEDIARGPLPARIQLPIGGFLHLLSALAPGELLVGEQREPLRVSDQSALSLIRVTLDAATGEVIVEHHLDGPAAPLVLATRGRAWAFTAGTFTRLDPPLPAALRAAYHAPLRIPRPAVPAFLQQDLPALEQQALVERTVSAQDLRFIPGTPALHLLLQGDLDHLQATLYADYGPQRAVAGRGLPDAAFCAPDPADPLRYLTRSEPAESEGLARLARHGLTGTTGDRLEPLRGAPAVLDFLARNVPALRQDGFAVSFAGTLESVARGATWLEPKLTVQAAGPGWFEINFQCSDGQGGSVSLDEIETALRQGDSHLERDGQTLLLDRASLTAVADLVDDAEDASTTRWKISATHAGYLMALLQSLRGVQVEADATVQTAAKAQNREAEAGLAEVTFPPDLARVLRGYQQYGVRWLRFLEAGGFGGVLADDMGLGKTVQALAWLQLARLHPACQGQPSLVVCPTSLIENWALEAAHFTPGLKTVVLSGTDRHQAWDDVPGAGLVITSYALLRRDIERHRTFDYAIAVLDEAQHIKNRSTQNARAAKRIEAHHRLVLTGTPIENSVADLWSIMDFLMPGYLGGYERFRRAYELPIAGGGPDGQAAQSRLRKKIHPFLLRRLKRDVATELPPRLERVAYCTMTSDQRNVYAKLLEQAQQEVTTLVGASGFARSRFAVLKTLTRLRQACCHLGLLKLPGLEIREPSAKLDLFRELLEEAMDGGHRVLVFSQFVTMLGLLREDLTRDGIPFCYLDGHTKDRIGEVTRFNRDADIPLFLISLKAGGTGLNLTGADTVIHFDPWWNPAVEDQATDRAHRIGQEKTVYAIKLITRDSVEEKVLELQQRKRAVIDAALAREEAALESLTWDDIRSLLSI